jgi:hypothetical protein
MHDAGVAHLKKLCRAEGGAKFFWVFRVKNHDFTPKNHIFSNFRGGGRRAPLDPPLRCTKFADYLTDNYVTQESRFPPSLWAESPSDARRTINEPESFHSHYNTQFYSSHASIFVFRDAILQI